MAYRKFKADHLFTGYNMLGSDRVLIAADDGTIHDIIPLAEAGTDIESFPGLIAPGFINCHCHLELSHLKGLIPEKTGLVDFVFTVVTQRHFPEEQIYEAIARAEAEMIANGIVAVGDICNNTHTLPQKAKRQLAYYNFIEASGWLPDLVASRFERSKNYYDAFTELSGENISMAPHAPYSVSGALWELITPYFAGRTTSIHNQETVFEDEFFREGTGDLKRMYELMRIDTGFFQPTGRSSLSSYLYKLDAAKQVLLVHNTFTHEDDLEYCTPFRSRQGTTDNGRIYFCLCANANLYIESAVPPLPLFRQYGFPVVLGTDSLASNHQLDILSEIKTLLRHFPSVPLPEMLQWATLNGAKALQMEKTMGSFEPGKKPGIISIEKATGSHLDEDAGSRRIL